MIQTDFFIAIPRPAEYKNYTHILSVPVRILVIRKRRYVMRCTVAAILALAMLLVFVGAAWADDQGDAKAVIDKAIKAAGGEEKLTPFAREPFTWKRKITGQTPDGKEIQITETGACQGNMVRMEHQGTVGDQKINMVQVCDGEKCYRKEGEETKELDREQAQQFLSNAYRLRLCILLEPLRDRNLTLAPADEVKVEGQTATGVKVTNKDLGTTQLYFDKENGQLLRATYRTVGHDGKEHDYELLLSQPKEMAGIRIPTRATVKQDGKPYTESEVVALQREEKLDRKVFEKP